MPFFELFKGHPFPGALAKFAMPPGPDDWQPKAWGIEGYTLDAGIWLFDDSAHFVDDGVEVGDIIYYITSDLTGPRAAIVEIVTSQTTLQWDFVNEVGEQNIVYKVGMKAPHTLQTLATIIGERGLYGYTNHWSTLWTQAPFSDFAHDETGDVYVCHNMDEQQLGKLLEKQYFDDENNPKANPWNNLNPEPVQ